MAAIVRRNSLHRIKLAARAPHLSGERTWKPWYQKEPVPTIVVMGTGFGLTVAGAHYFKRGSDMFNAFTATGAVLFFWPFVKEVLRRKREA